MKTNNQSIYFKGKIKNVVVKSSEAGEINSEVLVEKCSKKKENIVLNYKGYINNWTLDEKRNFFVDNNNNIIDVENLPIKVIPFPLPIYLLLITIKALYVLSRYLLMYAILTLIVLSLVLGYEDSEYVVEFLYLLLGAVVVVSELKLEDIYYFLPAIGLFIWSFFSLYSYIHKQIKSKRFVFCSLKGLSLWSKIKMID